MKPQHSDSGTVQKAAKWARLHLATVYGVILLSVVLSFGGASPKRASTGWLLLLVLALSSQLYLVCFQLPRNRDRVVRLAGYILVVPSIIILFAYIDWSVSAYTKNAFSKPLTKTDATYFTVATMTTVGYGDITPRSQLAERIVTGQIIAGFILAGFVFNRLWVNVSTNHKITGVDS